MQHVMWRDSIWCDTHLEFWSRDSLEKFDINPPQNRANMAIKGKSTTRNRFLVANFHVLASGDFMRFFIWGCESRVPHCKLMITSAFQIPIKSTKISTWLCLEKTLFKSLLMQNMELIRKGLQTTIRCLALNGFQTFKGQHADRPSSRVGCILSFRRENRTRK